MEELLKTPQKLTIKKSADIYDYKLLRQINVDVDTLDGYNGIKFIDIDFVCFCRVIDLFLHYLTFFFFHC